MAKSLLDRAKADLLAWASDFREGKVHRPLLAPHPEGYERGGAKISRVGFVPLAAYEFGDPGLIIVGGDEHKHRRQCWTLLQLKLARDGRRLVVSVRSDRTCS
jgi:hypothetical protein